MTKPLIKFRVYVPKSSLYYNVFVWQYKKDMHGAGNHNGIIGRNFAAFCASFRIIKEVSGRFRKTSQIGEIHFYKKQLGIEVITHESTHAILNALNELKFNFSKLRVEDNSISVTKQEELLCLLIGKFTRSLGDKFYKLGYYK